MNFALGHLAGTLATLRPTLANSCYFKMATRQGVTTWISTAIAGLPFRKIAFINRSSVVEFPISLMTVQTSSLTRLLLVH